MLKLTTGSGFTVTLTAADVFVHPFASVRVTENVPEAKTSICCDVSLPGDQR